MLTVAAGIIFVLVVWQALHLVVSWLYLPTAKSQARFARRMKAARAGDLDTLFSHKA